MPFAAAAAACVFSVSGADAGFTPATLRRRLRRVTRPGLQCQWPQHRSKQRYIQCPIWLTTRVAELRRQVPIPCASLSRAVSAWLTRRRCWHGRHERRWCGHPRHPRQRVACRRTGASRAELPCVARAHAPRCVAVLCRVLRFVAGWAAAPASRRRRGDLPSPGAGGLWRGPGRLIGAVGCANDGVIVRQRRVMLVAGLEQLSVKSEVRAGAACCLQLRSRATTKCSYSSGIAASSRCSLGAAESPA